MKEGESDDHFYILVDGEVEVIKALSSQAPMYFYRRGRGRFQAAPQETLQRAIAGMEKKRRIQAQVEDWTEALSQGSCPPEIAALKDELLYAPDRNKPETKALQGDS